MCVYIGCFRRDSKYFRGFSTEYIYIQDVSGGIVNILEGGFMECIYIYIYIYIYICIYIYIYIYI